MSQPFDNFRATLQSGGDDEIERALKTLAPGDVADLLVLAQSEASESRWWALYALATVAPAPGKDVPAAERVVPLLIERLCDDAAAVRAAAALAVAQLHERWPNTTLSTLATALAPLAARLRDDDGFVRQSAVDSLARCGERNRAGVVAVLQEALAGDHQGARGRAAQALHKLAASLAAQREALGVAAFDAAIAQLAPPLFGALNDKNYLVHTHAHESLEALGLLDNVLLTR